LTGATTHVKLNHDRISVVYNHTPDSRVKVMVLGREVVNFCVISIYLYCFIRCSL
jgi:hypothetical protein